MYISFAFHEPYYAYVSVIASYRPPCLINITRISHWITHIGQALFIMVYFYKLKLVCWQQSESDHLERNDRSFVHLQTDLQRFYLSDLYSRFEVHSLCTYSLSYETINAGLPEAHICWRLTSLSMFAWWFPVKMWVRLFIFMLGNEQSDFYCCAMTKRL